MIKRLLTTMIDREKTLQEEVQQEVSRASPWREGADYSGSGGSKGARQVLSNECRVLSDCRSVQVKHAPIPSA